MLHFYKLKLIFQKLTDRVPEQLKTYQNVTLQYTTIVCDIAAIDVLHNRMRDPYTSVKRTTLPTFDLIALLPPNPAHMANVHILVALKEKIANFNA